MKRASIIRFVFLSFWVLSTIAILPCMAAENFPVKPITILVGSTPGAAADLPVRAWAEPVSKRLGKPVLIANKPGGGGALMLNELFKAAPDGYTLGVLTGGGIINAHFLKVPYDPVKDFDPIIQYMSPHYGLVVKPDSPFKTLKDLIAYAAASPGKVKYSTSGIGYPHHLVMIQLGDSAKVKWVHVPFPGGQEAMTALLGGHVDCSSQTSAFAPFVKSGRARLLATYGEKRMASFPNVPTLIEQGYNIVAFSSYFIVAPKDIPRDRVKILHDAFYAGMQDPRFKQTLEQLDMETKYKNYEDSKQVIADIFRISGEIKAKIEK